MDPKLFKECLEKFAELKQLKTPKSAAFRENDEPETIFRGGKEFDVVADNNPTLNWIIKKIKPHVAVCEDCHDVVVDRRVEYKLNQSPKPHWNVRCSACDFCQDPSTGKFTMTGSELRTYQCSSQAQKSQLRPIFKKPTK
jgi:hypothetical protein